MKDRVRVFKWLIEAVGDEKTIQRTNEILGKNQEFICEEYLADVTKCSDGQEHKMWVCPNYAFLAEFCRRRSDWKTNFRIWQQEGNGKVRPLSIAWRL